MVKALSGMKKNNAIYEEITKFIWNESNLSVTLQKKYRIRIKKLELWKQGNYHRMKVVLDLKKN